ncbi:MAG: phosphoribosylglycinamide formyltransferase [Perlucidibaca sp.]
MSLRLVVLISGSGSNLQAVLDACGQSSRAGAGMNARVVGVLSNKADAFGLARATRAGVPTAVLDHTGYPDRESFDRAMAGVIDAWQPDVVVLAGFMRILSAGFVQHYAGRLLNIHPSLLPRYKGLHTHRRALAAGDAEHGCSVHFVTPELDGGPVIAQAVVRVEGTDNEETLADRVHAAEHRLYPAVLGWLADQRLQYRDGQPWFDGHPLAQPVRL